MLPGSRKVSLVLARPRRALTLGVAAQQGQPQIGIAPVTLSAGPYTFDTAEQHKIRVVVVARGLVHPFSLAFLPNGDALVTERGTKLRIVRGATGAQATLEPEPVAGLPAPAAVQNRRAAGSRAAPASSRRTVWCTSPTTRPARRDRTRTSDRAPSRLRADDSTARR